MNVLGTDAQLITNTLRNRHHQGVYNRSEQLAQRAIYMVKGHPFWGIYIPFTLVRIRQVPQHCVTIGEYALTKFHILFNVLEIFLRLSSQNNSYTQASKNH